MKAVPVLEVLNGALIWKTVVSGIGWYALAAERCPLTLRRAVYGYRNNSQDNYNDVIGFSVGNTCIPNDDFRILWMGVLFSLV